MLLQEVIDFYLYIARSDIKITSNYVYYMPCLLYTYEKKLGQTNVQLFTMNITSKSQIIYNNNKMVVCIIRGRRLLRL